MLRQVGIILFLVLFCATTLSVAQKNYYTATKIFYASDYTYQCDATTSFIVLYNANNMWTGTNQVVRSSGEEFEILDENVELFTAISWQEVKNQWQTIVDEAFSDEQKQSIGETELFINFYVNTETGKLDDVSFEFANFGPYAAIPVSVYRALEVKLKEVSQLVLTDEGEKLNYVYLWFAVAPRK